MKKIKLFIVALLCLFLSSNVYSNGLSLNSVGPRALGMGGAFVGLANDGSAIYWNPAGLIGQRSSLWLSATDIIPMASYKFAAYGIDAQSVTNHYFAPNFFFNYNIDDFALALGVYVPAGLGVEYVGKDLTAFTGGADLNWMSRIGVINFSPAIAYKVNDNFSLGLAANIFYGMFDMERAAVIPNVGAFQYSESSSGLGFGVTLGAMYKVNNDLSFGASFRTKTNVTMSGTAKNPAFAAMGGAKESKFDRDVAWPMWIAGGVAYKPIDKLTLTFDAQLSQWSKSEDVFKTKFDNAMWAGATAASGDDTFILAWEDKTQIRFGAEYNLSESLDLRAGFYTDPAPAPDETLNILFPSSSNSVISGGFGYKMDNIKIDFGAEYLIGAERNVNPSTENMPGKHQMNIFAFSLGFGYGL